eukprot:gb/GEZJ01004181.1/.p1 GENE.gb/GEZJ01004181.1/~~gb/GEZJ01004181.1/.p1  ORF type:complete len:126 (+),score=7.71 gb/GEZJ01004181.1/:1108-1485(+)
MMNNSTLPNLNGVISEPSSGSMGQNYFACVSGALQTDGVLERAAGAVASGCASNWGIACIEQSLIMTLCPSISGCVAGGIIIMNIFSKQISKQERVRFCNCTIIMFVVSQFPVLKIYISLLSHQD